MNTKKNFLLVFLVMSFLFLAIPSNSIFEVSISSRNNDNYSLTLETNNVEDVKVLALIGSGFGDGYFLVKDQLESWGCNVTTAGTLAIVPSCPNKPQRPVESDILVYDVDAEILSQFDCVYVPPGPHWVSLSINPTIHTILETAYTQGLVVSALCIGTIVLAKANNIVSGVKVVNYDGSYSEMVDAGAEIVFGSGVVSDKRMVTGGSGVYQADNPNVYPFCVAIVKEALGLSALQNIQINPLKGGVNETYTVSTEVTNLTGYFDENYTDTILQVRAIVHSDDPEIDDKNLYLYDLDFDGVYTANYTSTTKGPFSIEFEVKGTDYGIEVIRDAVNFKVKALPGFGIIIIPIVLTSIYIYRRKRL